MTYDDILYMKWKIKFMFETTNQKTHTHTPFSKKNHIGATVAIAMLSSSNGWTC